MLTTVRLCLSTWPSIPKDQPITQLLIDGDLYLYKAAAASEFEQDWGDGVWVLSSNLDQAKDMFRSQMKSFTDALGHEVGGIILSGSSTFRHTLTDDYKANRKGVRKPIVYKALTEWLSEEYPEKVFVKDILEADDYLGILATKPGSEWIIVSEDKDMLTLPTKVYRQGVLIEQSLEDADRYWMMQTLTGDAADGYKGCPGVGPVKASAIVDKPGETFENVLATFRKAGLTDEDAILQARLARILRWEDWDAKTQSVRLWSPPR